MGAGGRTAGPTARRLARVLELDDPGEVAREIEQTDSDPEGVGIMTRKARIYPVRVDGVSLKAAPLLKQELLAVGADSAHARGIADHSVPETVVILLGTLSQYRRVIPKLHRQPFGLSGVADALERALRSYTARAPRIIKGVRRSFQVGDHPRVMGVLNVTPDSFSDGGRYLDPERAVRRAEEMIAEGADLIDIGAESTRPGAEEIEPDLEWQRLAPVLERVAGFALIPISIDTRHAAVAEAALKAGADLINDVGGLRDPGMRKVLASTGAPVIALHMRGTPATMQADTNYADVRAEVYESLAARTDRAVSDGIAPEAILIDPGLGFGKSPVQNLELLAHLGEFRSLGYPVVVGASRKSFLGAAIGDLPVKDRFEAGLSAAVIAAWEGAHVIRTHDVGPTVRALRFADAVRRKGRRAGTRNGTGSVMEGPE